MKYRLLKDKITDLGWYFPYDKDPTVLECFGFACELQTYGDKAYIDILPDIVEEYVPSGMMDFEDETETILPLLKNDFFFKHDKKLRRISGSGGKFEVVEKEHYIHINRLWVEPIE